jgi:hypothetical protein
MTEAFIRRVFMKSGRPGAKIQRVKLSSERRRAVRAKTGGSCHVCGGRLGKDWQVDHVVPHKRGGVAHESNYLPACRQCNRLRWGYRPEVIRLMLRFGRCAKQEIRHRRPLGDNLIEVALRARN